MDRFLYQLFVVSFFCVTSAVTIAAPASEGVAESTPRWGIEVADARTFVGVLRVSLSVGVLEPDDDGYLTGRFSVRVPLLRSKNDDGDIKIPLEMSLEELKEAGGQLQGLAFSDDPEAEPRKIKCLVNVEEGTVGLIIHTPDRVLEFESTYELRQPESSKSSS